MSYYKIVLNDEIVDVVADPIWCKENAKGRQVRCEAAEAIGVVSSTGEAIWHIADRAEFSSGSYETVQIADITEEEYTEYLAILELGGTVSNDGDDVEWADDAGEETIAEDATLQEAIARKLELLSADCSEAIYAGVDVILEDGSVQHFGMDEHDQINLLLFVAVLDDGAEQVLFHADGELQRYYSAADIHLITQAATDNIAYHTTYYNSLKNWVQSLETITEVAAVQYGDAVPEAYCSEAWLEMEGTSEEGESDDTSADGDDENIEAELEGGG